MQLQHGDYALGGKYRIEILLGRGASADVYLATRVGLGLKRALKILRRDTDAVGSTLVRSFRDRFQIEAELQASFADHPRIVQVYDLDIEVDAPVLVMEYMRGGSLQAEIDAAAARTTRISVARTMAVLADIAEGLAALHPNYVHRDLKPSNVLLDQEREGRAKIADLGLAQTPNTINRSDGTNRAAHPGTPGFKSPEHEYAEIYLTPAADIYAAGVIAWLMLTGRMPPPAVSERRVEAVRRDVPDWLGDLIAGMLAPSPEDRPRDGRALADLLGKGRARDAEDQRALAERVAALKAQVAQALAQRAYGDADRLVSELQRIKPDDADVDRLGREVNLGLVAEKERVLRELQSIESRKLLREALSRQDWPAAAAAADQWLAVSPGEPEAMAGLSEARARLERLRQTAEARERASAAIATRDWREAATSVAAWRVLDPDDPALAQLDRTITDGLEQERRIVEARQTFDAALRKGDWAAAETALGRWESSGASDAATRGAVASARAELERQRRIAAASARAREASRARNWLAAREAADEWFFLAPGDDEARKALAEAEAELAVRAEADDALRLAKRRIEQRDWAGAEAALQRRLGMAPPDAGTLAAEKAIRQARESQRLAAAQKARAESAFAVGDLGLAAQAVDAWEKLSPDDPDLLVARGRLTQAASARRALEEARARTRKAMADGDWTAAREWVWKWQALGGEEPSAVEARDRIEAESERIRQVGVVSAETLALIDGKEWRQALEAAKRWQKLAPTDERAATCERTAAAGVARLDKLDALRRDLTARRQRGEWSAVLTVCAAIVELAPGDAEAAAVKSEAEASLKRARDIAAARTETDGLMAQERWPQAAESAKRWLALEASDSARAARDLIDAQLARLKRIDDARQETERLIASRWWAEAEIAHRQWSDLAMQGGPAGSVLPQALQAAREQIAAGLAELRRIADARKTAEADMARRNWASAVTTVAAWVRLAPQDPKAQEAQKTLAEELARGRRIAQARAETLQRMGESRWAEAKTAAARWIDEAPGDSEARASLERVEQGLVYARKVDEARQKALKLIDERCWREAADALAAWRAFDPLDEQARERVAFVAAQIGRERLAGLAAAETRRCIVAGNWAGADAAAARWAQAVPPGDTGLEQCRREIRDGRERAGRAAAAREKLRLAIRRDRPTDALEASRAWQEDAPGAAEPAAVAGAIKAVEEARSRVKRARAAAATGFKARAPGVMFKGLGDLARESVSARRLRRNLVWKHALSSLGRLGRMLVNVAVAMVVVIIVFSGLGLLLIQEPLCGARAWGCLSLNAAPISPVAVAAPTASIAPSATQAAAVAPTATPLPSRTPLPPPTGTSVPSPTPDRAIGAPAASPTAPPAPVAVSAVAVSDRDAGSASVAFNYTIAPEWVAAADRILFFVEPDAPPAGGERAVTAIACDTAAQARLNTAPIGPAAATGCLLPFNTDRAAPAGTLRITFAPPAAYRQAATVPFTTTRLSIVAVTWLKAGGTTQTVVATTPYNRVWR